MLRRKTLSFDFDNTLVNTAKCAIDLANKLYGFNVDVNSIDDKDIDWNLTNILPISNEQVGELFASKHLYDDAEKYIYKGWPEVLNQLSKDYDLEVVTLHSHGTIDIKYETVRRLFPQINKINIIPIYDELNVVFDKSCVTSEILLDDRADALKSCNAKYKIIYGNFQWNKDCVDYQRILSPNEFLNIVRDLKKNNHL